MQFSAESFKLVYQHSTISLSHRNIINIDLLDRFNSETLRKFQKPFSLELDQLDFVWKTHFHFSFTFINFPIRLNDWTLESK